MIEVPELALSMIQPMGTAVVRGWKPFENRKWKPWPRVIGKLVAFHASAKWDHDYAEFIASLMPEQFRRIGGHQVPQSAIIGVARVTGWITANERGEAIWYATPTTPCKGKLLTELDGHRWFTGPYGWTLTDAREIDPIPCKGSLGLWRIPEWERSLLGEQLAKAA